MKRLPARLRRFWHDLSGAVAMEFALIAPILIALLFGIVFLGYFMGIAHSVNQLATGAARASVAGLDRAERQSLAETYPAEAPTRYPLLSAAAIAPTVRFSAGPPSGINVAVRYHMRGSVLDLANGFLRLDMQRVERSAYLAY